MRIHTRFFSLLLGAFGITSSSAKPLVPFPSSRHITQQPTQNHQALQLRGGAGRLDVDQVARLATVAGGVNSLWFALSPKASIESHGVETSDWQEWFHFRIATKLVGIFGLAWGLFWGKLNVEQSVGISLIPWMIDQAKTIVNDECRDMTNGATLSRAHHGFLLIHSMACYACLSGSKHARTCMTIVTVHSLLNGITMAIAPIAISNLWGCPKDQSNAFSMRSHGFYMMSYGVFVAALLYGGSSMEHTKALGLAWIPLLVHFFLADFASLGDNYLLNLSKSKLRGWIVTAMGIVYTLAI